MENVVQFKNKSGDPVVAPPAKTLEREVKTFHVEAICPKCDTIMVQKPFAEAMALWKGRPGVEFYPHVCGNESCKHEEHYPIRYPTLVYRFVE